MADDGGLRHLGVVGGDVFHLDGGDPLAAGLDHILGAVGDRHVALSVYGGDVAGLKPALLGVGIRAVQLEVTGTDPGSAHLEGTEGNAIPGLLRAGVADDFHLDAEDRPARLEPHFGKLLVAVALAIGGTAVDTAQRAHLSHAPADPGFHPVFVEILHDRQRAGRAADDDAIEGVNPHAR